MLHEHLQWYAVRLHRFVEDEQPAGECDLQLLLASAASAASAAATPAASAASSDADVPGWIGDPGDGYVPGAASASAAAAAGARARLSQGRRAKNNRLGLLAWAGFLMSSADPAGGGLSV